MQRAQHAASWLALRLDRLNRLAVGVLMAVLIIDVWVGVVDRYLLHWQINWVEEAARYFMIWAILLAVPSCTYHRQHIRLELLCDALPRSVRIPLARLTEVITFAFFSYLAIAGQGLVADGFEQFSGLFGMPMAVPYAAIPVSFGLAAVQTLLVFIIGFHSDPRDPQTLEELEA